MAAKWGKGEKERKQEKLQPLYHARVSLFKRSTHRFKLSPTSRHLEVKSSSQYLLQLLLPPWRHKPIDITVQS